MKRVFDILVASILLILLLPPLLVLAAVIRFKLGTPILFSQIRPGLNGNPFKLYKFRTMTNALDADGNLLTDEDRLTPFGRLLRRTSLDELPELWNVLRGDMSLVGPRPNLFNQTELIAERGKRGVYGVRPGITGLAQIHKIDMSTPLLLAETDARMILHLNVWNFFKYIFLTVFGKGFGDRVVNQK